MTFEVGQRQNTLLSTSDSGTRLVTPPAPLGRVVLALGMATTWMEAGFVWRSPAGDVTPLAWAEGGTEAGWACQWEGGEVVDSAAAEAVSKLQARW